MARRKGTAHKIGKAVIFTSNVVMFFLKGAYQVLSGVGSVMLFTAKTVKKKKAKTEETKETKKTAKITAKRPRTKAKYTGIKAIKSIKGKANTFEDALINAESTIGIILGARGTGKSAIGLKLLENIHAKTGKAVHALGFKAKDLPSWIDVVDNPEEVENDSVVLIDEGGISFSSRKSMSNANQLLSSLLMIARHKNISVLFITQNSSNLEVNVLRQADFLIMKPSSLMQKDFERKKIKEVYEAVEQEFESLKGMKGITYIHSNQYQGFITNELPSFWSTKVSKAFR